MFSACIKSSPCIWVETPWSAKTRTLKAALTYNVPSTTLMARVVKHEWSLILTSRDWHHLRNFPWKSGSSTLVWGLYSPPLIPPRIPLESWNSAGLDPEFDILPDCRWNITGMVFLLFCLVSLYQVLPDSMKILQIHGLSSRIPWDRWKFPVWFSHEIIHVHVRYMCNLMWGYKHDATTCDMASFPQTTTTNTWQWLPPTTTNTQQP